MIRYLTWSLFILLTLGMVDFNVVYDDGLELHYRLWLEDLIEKMEGK